MRDDQMSLAELRRQVPPEVYRAVEEAVNKGWTLRKQGHKAYLYCPCEQGGGKCAIPGTPKSAGNTARRIRRNLEHCPDAHVLMK